MADFYVIYNRALSSLSETDDCKLSLEFTEYLIQILEDEGHKGHFADRDAIAGSNIFTQLFQNTTETRKTFLVVTPGFLSNCWTKYASMAAFKSLIDTEKCDKLIPIGIGIAENQKLPELNIKDWIHFTRDFTLDNTDNNRKWDIIRKALSHEGPLSTELTYQEYLHDQEHGDNKLRTDTKQFLVQPNSLQDQNKEFFTEKFLLNFGVHFLSNWKVLALTLGLTDERVNEAEQNNRNDVKMQAYSALSMWKKAYGMNQGKMMKDLSEVLLEMGRRDLMEDIESKYNEFMRQFENPKEGIDEVDMGMSRNRGDNLYVRRTREAFDKKEPLSLERGENSGEFTHSETYMALELKPESTAYIDLKPRPESQMSSLNSLELECGPSMSLPSAPVVSLPPNKATKKLPKNANTQQQINITNKKETSISEKTEGRDVSNEQTHSNAGTTNTTEPVPVDEQITPSQRANLNQEVYQTPSSKDVNNKYKSQQSLSRDTDLSADVHGSFPYASKPNNLPLHGSGDGVECSNQISHNAQQVAGIPRDSGYISSSSQSLLDEQVIPNLGNQSKEVENSTNNSGDATDKVDVAHSAADINPDSGYSRSSSQTPIDEQIILNKENQSQEAENSTNNATDAGATRSAADITPDSGFSGSSSQTPIDEQTILNKENQSQEAENSTNNATDASDNTLNSSDSLSAVQSPIGDQIIANKGNQSQEGFITTEKSKGNGVGTDGMSLGLNTNSAEFNGQRVTDENSRSLQPKQDSSNSSPGQSQSLGYTMFRYIWNGIMKPELAYS